MVHLVLVNISSISLLYTCYNIICYLFYVTVVYQGNIFIIVYKLYCIQGIQFPYLHSHIRLNEQFKSHFKHSYIINYLLNSVWLLYFAFWDISGQEIATGYWTFSNHFYTNVWPFELISHAQYITWLIKNRYVQANFRPYFLFWIYSCLCISYISYLVLIALIFHHTGAIMNWKRNWN